MKYHLYYFLLFAIVFFTACNNQKMEEKKLHKEPVFPKGEKVVSENFTGNVWLNYLVETDTIHNVNIGSVTFEPGARTN